MKSLFAGFLILMAFVLTPALSNAQTTQGPPISQPLVREGTLAVTLAEALKLGTPADEIEAESLLGTAGISPLNGWIADYPVTPDIVDELQASITEAADVGILTMGRDEALKAFQDVMAGFMLNVYADTSGQEPEYMAGPEYPDSGVINEYYSTGEGPPVVTYYAPPPDYAYLYTWVPYPFWWLDVRFSGFFVLADFERRGRGHRHDRGHDRRHGENISNHFRDPGTGRTVRIDPANRPHFRYSRDRKGSGQVVPFSRGGTKAGPFISPGSQPGTRTRTFVAPSVNLAPVNRARPIAPPAKEFRGHIESRPAVPSTGTRSSAFDRSVNSKAERAASDRGFESRSKAGQVDGRTWGRSPGGTGGGSPRGGGGFHGGGRKK